MSLNSIPFPPPTTGDAKSIGASPVRAKGLHQVGVQLDLASPRAMRSPIGASPVGAKGLHLVSLQLDLRLTLSRGAVDAGDAAPQGRAAHGRRRRRRCRHLRFFVSLADFRSLEGFLRFRIPRGPISGPGPAENRKRQGLTVRGPETNFERIWVWVQRPEQGCSRSESIRSDPQASIPT